MMAPRPVPRSEPASRALAALRTATAGIQRNSRVTDEEMADILGSLRGTYARRAHRAAEAASAVPVRAEGRR